MRHRTYPYGGVRNPDVGDEGGFFRLKAEATCEAERQTGVESYNLSPERPVRSHEPVRGRVTPIRPVTGIEAGRAALARGDWEGARAAFQESLETVENPEALEGL